jgi:hypothetical protein
MNKATIKINQEPIRSERNPQAEPILNSSGRHDLEPI